MKSLQRSYPVIAPSGQTSIARGEAQRNPWRNPPRFPCMLIAPRGRTSIARGEAERNPWFTVTLVSGPNGADVGQKILSTDTRETGLGSPRWGFRSFSCDDPGVAPLAIDVRPFGAIGTAHIQRPGSTEIKKLPKSALVFVPTWTRSFGTRSWDLRPGLLSVVPTGTRARAAQGPGTYVLGYYLSSLPGLKYGAYPGGGE
jgi:hypothetical protein